LHLTARQTSFAAEGLAPQGGEEVNLVCLVVQKGSDAVISLQGRYMPAAQARRKATSPPATTSSTSPTASRCFRCARASPTAKYLS